MRITVGTPRQGMILEEGRLEALQTSRDSADDAVMQQVLRVVDQPSCEIALEISGPAGSRRVSFAIGEGIASVVMARPGHPGELAAVTMDSVPGVVARATGLGPAPYVEDPDFKIPEADVDALMADPPVVSERLMRHPIGEVLTGNVWQVWTAWVSTLQPDGEVRGERLDIVGAAGLGWWMLVPGRNKVRVTRTRALSVWMMMCELIPNP